VVVAVVDLEREVLVGVVVMFGYVYFLLFLINQWSFLFIRYVPEKHFYHMLFVSENGIIKEENIIKVCMLVWVLVQVIMLEVE
jgi:hypothetical protein